MGRGLIECLSKVARRLGYHKMVLAAFPFNESGIALYARMGFQTAGVYREQGRLDGRWVDMEKLLSPLSRVMGRMFGDPQFVTIVP